MKLKLRESGWLLTAPLHQLPVVAFRSRKHSEKKFKSRRYYFKSLVGLLPPPAPGDDWRTQHDECVTVIITDVKRAGIVSSAEVGLTPSMTALPRGPLRRGSPWQGHAQPRCTLLALPWAGGCGGSGANRITYSERFWLSRMSPARRPASQNRLSGWRPASSSCQIFSFTAMLFSQSIFYTSPWRITTSPATSPLVFIRFQPLRLDRFALAQSRPFSALFL